MELKIDVKARFQKHLYLLESEDFIMSYDKDTVSGTSNFPVIDITHKPKRRQGDMIRLKEQSEGISLTDSTSETPNSEDDVPTSITLERAISYYKKQSNDRAKGKLYEATAKWLEELLVTRSVKTTEAARNAQKSDTKE